MSHQNSTKCIHSRNSKQKHLQNTKGDEEEKQAKEHECEEHSANIESLKNLLGHNVAGGKFASPIAKLGLSKRVDALKKEEERLTKACQKYSPQPTFCLPARRAGKTFPALTLSMEPPIAVARHLLSGRMVGLCSLGGASFCPVA